MPNSRPTPPDSNPRPTQLPTENPGGGAAGPGPGVARPEREEREPRQGGQGTGPTGDPLPASGDEGSKKRAQADRTAEPEQKREERPLEAEFTVGGGTAEEPDAEHPPLQAGVVFAPKSNPGAAAKVPDRPLEPESLQSHGKGIVTDKDLTNPPYGGEGVDPVEVDAPPSGSGSPTNTPTQKGPGA